MTAPKFAKESTMTIDDLNQLYKQVEEVEKNNRTLIKQVIHKNKLIGMAIKGIEDYGDPDYCVELELILKELKGKSQ